MFLSLNLYLYTHLPNSLFQHYLHDGNQEAHWHRLPWGEEDALCFYTVLPKPFLPNELARLSLTTTPISTRTAMSSRIWRFPGVSGDFVLFLMVGVPFATLSWEVSWHLFVNLQGHSGHKSLLRPSSVTCWHRLYLNSMIVSGMLCSSSFLTNLR